MDSSLIARVAHEADRAFVATQGQMPEKVWVALDAWQRDSAVRGVKATIANPTLGVHELHALWRRDKAEAGWSCGPAFDLSRKLDPLMVPWDRLPPAARRRDELFVAIVRALATTH